MAWTVIVRSVPGARFTQEVEACNHQLIGGEPVAVGGSDRGPGPYEYLRSVEVRLSRARIHARDCEANGLPVFISPHYYYPTDHGWKFEGTLEKVMHQINMFDRAGPLDLDNFAVLSCSELPFKPARACRVSRA